MGKLQKVLKAACLLLAVCFVFGASVSYASNKSFDRKNEGKKPQVHLYATSYSIKNGDSTTLYWQAKRADACIAHGFGWSGLRQTGATEVVSPTANTKYFITCVNAYGSHTDSATITVKGKIKPPVNPPPAPDPIPDPVPDPTPEPDPEPVDVCPNIEGNQATVPSGYHKEGDNCIEDEIIPIPNPDILDHLLISEVNYLNATLGEWVEIYNGTGASMTMEGWTISDAISSDLIATTTIPNNGFVLITGSTTLAASLPTVTVVTLSNTTIGGGLNDGGDAVYLKNKDGVIVDAMSYGTNSDVFSPSVAIGGSFVLKRTSLVSDTNTALDWATSTVATPGSF